MSQALPDPRVTVCAFPMSGVSCMHRRWEKHHWVILTLATLDLGGGFHVLVMAQMRKNLKKNGYMCTRVADSLCWTPETNTTL